MKRHQSMHLSHLESADCGAVCSVSVSVAVSMSDKQGYSRPSLETGDTLIRL